MSETTRALLAEIRADDLAYDPWGTAMSWHIAIADAMTEWAPPYPPAAWGYRQALRGVDDLDPNYRAVVNIMEATGGDAGDLLYVGNLLHRFERLCERKGLDY